MPKRKAASTQNKNSKKTKMGGSISNTTPAKRHNKLKKGQNKTSNLHIEYKTLAEYGYHFQNGKLISTEDGQPFKFDVFSDIEENQKRYESIGKLIDNYVFEQLESTCKLKRVTVPTDAKKNEPTSFIFISNDLSTADFLMVIIHGTGVVRAGQWSRKLIINENMAVGSQIEYIKRAQADGYAVIVTNTNLNAVGSGRTLRHDTKFPIRGSETAEAHGCYVWENFIRQSPAEHIAIMAHSYGGAVVLEMAARFQKEFNECVFAVALTDSPMAIYGRRIKGSVLKMLKKKAINWVADTENVDTDLGEDDCCQLRSAGHTVHEWTSHTAIDAIFRYFSAERKKLNSS